jgi:hypothetical protein
MSYTALSPDIQNLLATQFDFFIKFALLAVLVGVCFFYGRKLKLEKTKYYGVRIFKMLIKWSSYVVLFLSPLMFFLLAPQISLDVVVRLMIWVYSLVFVGFFLICAINIPMYGFSIFADFGGYKGDEAKFHKRVNKDIGGFK